MHKNTSKEHIIYVYSIPWAFLGPPWILKWSQRFQGEAAGRLRELSVSQKAKMNVPKAGTTGPIGPYRLGSLA